MNPDNVLTLYPPAKVNPFLEVRGERADGYHEIETLIVKISLRDRLEVRRSEKYELTCRPDVGVRSEDNLVTKAVLCLEKAVGRPLPASVRLWKHIPHGAGLGGGSSDAASMLVALNRLYGLGLRRRELAEAAVGVGSDVASFLYPGAVLCRGRGERIADFCLVRGFTLHVVFPGLRLSTAAVYGGLKSGLTKEVKDVYFTQWREALREGRLPPAALFNRLEEAAESVDGRIGRVRRDIGGIPRDGMLLSGSGSAFFVQLPTAEARMRLYERASAGGWTVHRCRTVNA